MTNEKGFGNSWKNDLIESSAFRSISVGFIKEVLSRCIYFDQKWRHREFSQIEMFNLA